jgi:hypothetical protein
MEPKGSGHNLFLLFQGLIANNENFLCSFFYSPVVYFNDKSTLLEKILHPLSIVFTGL